MERDLGPLRGAPAQHGRFLMIAPQHLGTRRQRSYAAPAGEKSGGRADRGKSGTAPKRAPGSVLSQSLQTMPYTEIREREKYY